MKIKYPSNFTAKKYSKFAHNFDDCDDAVRGVGAGRIVIYWDNASNPDDTPVCEVGFLQEVRYYRNAVKYGVLTLDGYVLNYDHASPIEEEHCPRVFVRDEDAAAVGRLIGVQYDEDKKTYKFLVHLLPFESCIYKTLTADELMFVDDAQMGVEDKVDG